MFSCFKGEPQHNCGVESFYQTLEDKCGTLDKDMVDPAIELVKSIVGQSLKKYSIIEEGIDNKSIKIKIKQEKDRYLTINKENLVVPKKLEFEISFMVRTFESKDPIFYININFKEKKIAAPFTENEVDHCLMVWKQIRYNGAQEKYTIMKQVFQKNKPVYNNDGSFNKDILEFERSQLNHPFGSSIKKSQ